jgi:hypothetical protein
MYQNVNIRFTPTCLLPRDHSRDDQGGHIIIISCTFTVSCAKSQNVNTTSPRQRKAHEHIVTYTEPLEPTFELPMYRDCKCMVTYLLMPRVDVVYLMPVQQHHLSIEQHTKLYDCGCRCLTDDLFDERLPTTVLGPRIDIHAESEPYVETHNLVPRYELCAVYTYAINTLTSP